MTSWLSKIHASFPQYIFIPGKWLHSHRQHFPVLLHPDGAIRLDRSQGTGLMQMHSPLLDFSKHSLHKELLCSHLGEHTTFEWHQTHFINNQAMSSLVWFLGSGWKCSLGRGELKGITFFLTSWHFGCSGILLNLVYWNAAFWKN